MSSWGQLLLLLQLHCYAMASHDQHTACMGIERLCAVALLLAMHRNRQLIVEMLLQLAVVVDGAQLPLLERQDMLVTARRMAAVIRKNADRWALIVQRGLGL